MITRSWSGRQTMFIQNIFIWQKQEFAFVSVHTSSSALDRGSLQTIRGKHKKKRREKKEIHYSEQRSPELLQPVHLKMTIYAETCSEIVSNTGTMKYVAQKPLNQAHKHFKVTSTADSHATEL